MSTTKYICGNCGKKLYENQLLVASHPFDEDEELWGCPACKDIDDLYRACEAEECWFKATCGIPTAQGYQRLCGNHYSAANLLEEEK